MIVAVLGLGYVSSLPTLTHYDDGTQTKRNTLTPAGQEFLADLMTGNITPQMSEVSREFNTIRRYDMKLATVTACGVEQIADAGFTVIDGIVTDSTGVWNERQTRNFVDETPTLDARSGEVEKPYSLMKYLAQRH